MYRMFLISLFAIASLGMAGDDAFAAKKKKKGLGSRSDYTSEQRNLLYEEARKICRKKFGPIGRVEINYITGQIVCWAN